MKNWFFGLLLLLTTSFAHAYIDPGTGIALWQGLLVAIAAVVAFVKNPLSFFKKKPKEEKDE